LVLKLVKGTVKWFNSRKGYGFISSEEGSDVFVHYTALSGRDDEYKTLNENDKVEFEVVDGQKGPQASNVVITEKAPPNPYNRGRRGNFRF
jgi:CspA family cold shock protein